MRIMLDSGRVSALLCKYEVRMCAIFGVSCDGTRLSGLVAKWCTASRHSQRVILGEKLARKKQGQANDLCGQRRHRPVGWAQ